MYQRARLGSANLPQEASIFPGLTVEQEYPRGAGGRRANKKKAEAELNSLLDEFNITRPGKTPSIALSGGERRRVEIGAGPLRPVPITCCSDEPSPVSIRSRWVTSRTWSAPHNRGIGVLYYRPYVRERWG